jgi:hypothetical protein
MNVKVDMAVNIYVWIHMEVIDANVKRDTNVPIWIISIVMIKMNVPLDVQIVMRVAMCLEGKLSEMMTKTFLYYFPNLYWFL